MALSAGKFLLPALALAVGEHAEASPRVGPRLVVTPRGYARVPLSFVGCNQPASGLGLPMGIIGRRRGVELHVQVDSVTLATLGSLATT